MERGLQAEGRRVPRRPREDCTSTLHSVSTQPPPYLHPAYTVKRLSGEIGVVPDLAKTPNQLPRSAPSRRYRYPRR